MVRFIGVIHANPELAAPFVDVHEAMLDLQNGILPELFDPNPALRERARTRRRKHIQLTAAVLVEALMQSRQLIGGSCRDRCAGRKRWPVWAHRL